MLGIFQLQTGQVSARDRIRGEYQRPDRNRIGSSTYIRGERPTGNAGNDINNNDNIIDEGTLNLVLVPECNPSNSDSFYSLSKREENKGRTDYLEDRTTDCDRYLDYCDKKISNMEMSWSNYVYPDDFYGTVELLYDRCFKSCVEYLPGGVDQFCSMPEPEDPPPTAGYNSASSSAQEYCKSVDGDDWTASMVAHEAAVLEVLNAMRAEPDGQACAEGFFPRASPVVTNDSLRCAARIQAQNIVKETIETGRFPSNLHDACPSKNFDGSDPICERFSTRMEKSGYSYYVNGFGYINEVTAAGYQSPEAVIQGWLSSKSGHCSAIVKQESLVIPTEVGIGYYKDEATGKTGHVMVLGQRQL